MVQNLALKHGGLSRQREIYLSGIVQGSRQLVRSAVDEALNRGAQVRTVVSEIVIPAQRSLGEMWRKGEISIAEEHRATELTVEIISYLREHIVPKPALDKKALVAAVEGDQHLLGARIVADMLYEDGWDVEFLGGNTPNEAFVEHLAKFPADIILISASAEIFLPALKALAGLLRKRFPGLIIIAGGIALLTGKTTAKELGVDYIACAFEDAISNARKALGIEGGVASLNQLLGTVGSRIRHYRTECGISQQELARRAKLDRAYISSLENGKKNISVGTLLRIAEAVDTEVKNLIS